MSTRSCIAVQNQDETFRYVYCHYDGYPSHQVPLLTGHYADLGSVNSLIELGDLSSLAERAGKPRGHSFDTPVKGYCVAYGRDRGEKGVEAGTAEDLDALRFAAEQMNAEFLYAFIGGQWLAAKVPRLRSRVPFVPVDDFPIAEESAS